VATLLYPMPAPANHCQNQSHLIPQAWADCFGGAITREAYLASIETAGFPELEILKSREYVKNGYDFISLTIRGTKPQIL